MHTYCKVRPLINLIAHWFVHYTIISNTIPFSFITKLVTLFPKRDLTNKKVLSKFSEILLKNVNEELHNLIIIRDRKIAWNRNTVFVELHARHFYLRIRYINLFSIYLKKTR